MTPEKTKKPQSKINQKIMSSVSLSEKTRQSVLNQPSQSSTSTSEPQVHPSQGEAERRGPTSSSRGQGKRSHPPTSYDSEDEIKVSKVKNSNFDEHFICFTVKGKDQDLNENC